MFALSGAGVCNKIYHYRIFMFMQTETLHQQRIIHAYVLTLHYMISIKLEINTFNLTTARIHSKHIHVLLTSWLHPLPFLYQICKLLIVLLILYSVFPSTFILLLTSTFRIFVSSGYC